MNDREALKHIKATIGAFGPDEGIELDQKAWSKLHSAIKEALAQPEQKPAYSSCFRCVTPKKCSVYGCCPNTWPSENATPPQRNPLTDEEISEIAINNPPMVHEFARAIEAAHGIKE